METGGFRIKNQNSHIHQNVKIQLNHKINVFFFFGRMKVIHVWYNMRASKWFQIDYSDYRCSFFCVIFKSHIRLCACMCLLILFAGSSLHGKHWQISDVKWKLLLLEYDAGWLGNDISILLNSSSTLMFFWTIFVLYVLTLYCFSW